MTTRESRRYLHSCRRANTEAALFTWEGMKFSFFKVPKCVFFLSHQDHADEADDEIVGESDQPGGDEVVDGATPATSQPSHVAGLGFKRFGDETRNLSFQRDNRSCGFHQ